MPAPFPLSTLLSQPLVAYTIELDNEFERRFVETGQRARVASVVMWSNFLRFVGDGIEVGALPEAAGLPKARMLSIVGGMERWRYVFVAAASARTPPKSKREGWGSGRALRKDWVVRPTSAGRKAQEIWPLLFDEVDTRWAERFGGDAVGQLEGSLRSVVDRLDAELPEYPPIVASSDGMAAGFSPREQGTAGESRVHLPALLSQVLLAYTLDFERESDLSLPMDSNFMSVLDETGVRVADLTRAAGVSKEATNIALKFLTKVGLVLVDGASAPTKRARLTANGLEVRNSLRRRHVLVEKGWKRRFGAGDVDRLRSSLEAVLTHPDLSRGLHPHPGGWRASKPYLERTEAMLEDPRSALPHYPMVLHRGGWPDGS